MKKKYSFCFYLVLFSVFIFPQNSEDMLSFRPLDGVWENGGRFIEFAPTEKTNEKNMRIALKPYYRFVYDAPVKLNASAFSESAEPDLYFLRISYPRVKKAVSLSVFIHNNFLYTSYYKKIEFSSKKAKKIDNGMSDTKTQKSSVLYGFWVEQGSRDGILLYPNEPVKFFDAYFFLDDVYIKFKYWLDDITYNSKTVSFKDADGNSYFVPRFIKRGGLTYSCMTAGGANLRNYETGVYFVDSDKNAEKRGVFLTLTPKGAGPYSNSAGNTYPNPKYASIENIMLDISNNGNIFAIGDPFLIKSSIIDLTAEIMKHNAERKKPVQPDIIDDDLNFFWSEIDRLHK